MSFMLVAITCLIAALGIAGAVWLLASSRLRRRVAVVESQIAYSAKHDALTGFLNRTAFARATNLLIRQPAAGAGPGVLLYLDLDGFKDINDNHGHHAGDAVLLDIALRIESVLPRTAILGRLGGDEFGIALAGTEPQACQQYLDAIAVQLARSIELDGSRISLGISIGATTLDGSTPSFDEALRRADVALYEAKRAGRGQTVYFDARMDERVRERIRLLTDLKAAIGSDQFYLAYQPEVDVSLTMKGVEALLRWRHPTRGLVRPDQFIALAEQSGLIVDLGLAVIDMACADLVRARRSGTNLRYVSVNISARQLQEPSFPDELLHRLRSHGLGARDLELELTESCLIDGSSQAEQAIDRLAASGFRIAIDDFGTGYSSLSRLHRMPVDKLKIDRSFVMNLFNGVDDTGRTVTEAILEMAKRLALRVVAEGIETPEQADWLVAAGCELMQGFYFARPMPMDALIEWDEARSPQAGSSPGQWNDTEPLVEAMD